MSQPNPALNESPRRELPETGWLEELAAALERAAELAAANGISGDTFKRAAWDAYLNARPGLREKLEDDPGDPSFILTVRGAGYAFAER